MTETFRIADGVLTILPEAAYLRTQEYAGRGDFKKLIISEGVGFFESEAFAECPALEEAVLPEGIINVGVAAFTGCAKLRSINLPESVSEIEEGAFLDCEELREVRFPSKLKRIADLAFQNTGLREVLIPRSVTEIGDEAFFECPQLRRADVLGEETRIGSDAFGSCYLLGEGFIAPGFPVEFSRPSELLFSILWAGCPDRHGETVSSRAEAFIRANSQLVMEKILKNNNIPAMTGIAARGLFTPEEIDRFVEQSLDMELTEITALLLSAKGSGRDAGDEGEFEL